MLLVAAGSRMMNRSSFSRLTWLVKAGLEKHQEPLNVVSQFNVMCVCLRFRRHRKAVVSSGDKKMPNGILEEQGKGGVVFLLYGSCVCVHMFLC